MNKGQILIFCDIAITLSILFNIGAVLITNAMAMKASPEAPLLEANPIAAKTLNVVVASDGKAMIAGIILHCLLLGTLIANYIYYRVRSEQDKHFYWLLIFTCFIFLATTLDFTNDLGYWLGKLIFSNI